MAEMAGKQPKRPKRWSLTAPDTAVEPRGPKNAVRRAVGLLGPFRSRFREDATGHRPVEERIPLSEQLAFERVLILARGYNERAYLDRNAPRSKDVIDKLNKVEELAGELARSLSSLDDMTRHLLQTGGTGVAGFEDFDFLPLMQDADAAGLPRPANGTETIGAGRWVDRLRALSQYTNWCVNTFLIRLGVEDAEAADKGGNTNLYKSGVGPARWYIVTEGWALYELFKPGEATGTDGGPFHQFLDAVFEYATGEDPAENAKLSYWLKTISKVNRRYKEIQERLMALQDEGDELFYAGDLSKKDRDRRSEDLRKEIIALEQERADLWYRRFPFSWTKASGREP